ncbi:protein-glutamate methylesterase/protein-glutamine glutaminase [Thioclava nitratireducens]|uniref:protein-glutamate methylesterase/protein-glutamine glutaminase n=1 Tax=Thioclava nitratireducens TaxID=1915078 RepID=UPI00248051AD|nr:chemotaxis response regulator protein-glutamate methylesterase [Thioclava nitratireducens]WGT49908.1 chemotaxis response regulator protein-glutamate methylesterase [Thioclava nitratireducens]
MMAQIKVLIVDDSASARKALCELLGADPAIRVTATARDAFDAAEKMRDALPDVMLLDLELPRMNGLTFLAKIMAQHPLPVVVCSSHTDAGSHAAMRALEIGAREVVGKPRLTSPEARQEAQIRLSDAVRAAAKAGGLRGFGDRASARLKAEPTQLSPGPKLTADVILPPPRPGAPIPSGVGPLVVIGASTGGTEALATLLPRLAPTTPPVVIVQHMPEKFTAAFARRLDGLCSVSVSEAVDGDRPVPGSVLIAPGDRHLILRRQGAGYRVGILDGPYVARHRPSVDVLFRSAAIAAGPAALGILMTGMGDDGARGLAEMRAVGAQTIAQDKPTSVVWGMPGEAMRIGAAERAVPLQGLATEIARYEMRVGAA